MIQMKTMLNVIDNSGARVAQCIKSLRGPRKPASVGDQVVVTVKKTKLLPSTQGKQSVKKGEVKHGIVVRCRVCICYSCVIPGWCSFLLSVPRFSFSRGFRVLSIAFYVAKFIYCDGEQCRILNILNCLGHAVFLCPFSQYLTLFKTFALGSSTRN